MIVFFYSNDCRKINPDMPLFKLAREEIRGLTDEGVVIRNNRHGPLPEMLLWDGRA